jgi:hypothetical protein
MTEKKQTAKKQQPVHVIHAGEATGGVTAEVYIFQSNTGFPYLGYTISRRWNSRATGKETTGVIFFENSSNALVDVVQKVAEWLRTEGQAVLAAEQTNKQPSLGR